jgi:hypothetical protein
MAKNKKQPLLKLTSPGNYIRQKVRNLPIHECLINDGWQKEGTAQIVIARRHTTGNITYAMYMVDLLCLGVRDTFYKFNNSEHEYDEMVERLSENTQMIEVDYTLVYNIIYAALEFAEDYGFKPHKDFTSVTRYMLEEDTDDIELIEIECGRDGKPVFINTDSFTDAEARTIITQLGKTAGTGNYDVISSFDEYEDDEDNSDLFDKYEAITPEERRMAFVYLVGKDIEDLTSDEHRRLLVLTNTMYSLDLTEDNKVDEMLDKWEPELQMKISEHEYTADSLGLESGTAITEEQEDTFYNTEFEWPDEPDKVKEAFNNLLKQWGDIPYLCYKKLVGETDDDNYNELLDKYCTQYPDYALLRMQKVKSDLMEAKITNWDLYNIKTVFGERTSVTDLEMFEYQTGKILIMLHANILDTNDLEAQRHLLDSLDINESFIKSLQALLLLVMISRLKDVLKLNA